MKAILLAAGRGSRMEEGTKDKPKCLMELGGKPLLSYCVESLAAAGFSQEDMGIVTGYRSDLIQLEGARLFHNEEWAETNMFVSLTKARGWLLTEPCIVSYTDIVYSANAVKALMESVAEFAITYITDFWELWSKRLENPLEDLETFRVEDGILTEIGKKPVSKEEIEGQYMGLLRFTPAGWQKVEEAIHLPMPKSVEKLDMTTLLQHLIGLGHRIEAIPTGDLWLECDHMQDIQVYEREYTDRLTKGQ